MVASVGLATRCVVAAACVLALAGRVGAATVDHAPWTAILQQYVDDDGRVAYRRLLTESRAQFETYLQTLAAADPEALPEKERLAFWLNAYNATIVAGVLDGYSAENAFKRLRLFKTFERPIAGAERSPEGIEHGIIRPRFADPRTHFALVCASTSCPTLRREAYIGERLDAQLDDQARGFLSDRRRNIIDPATQTLALSQIFDWFAGDFTAAGQTLADRLAPYLTAEQAVLLRDRKPTYLEYDWTMNAQPGQRPQ
jgi:hypothetical protein